MNNLQSSSLGDWLSRLEKAHPSAIELGLDRVSQVRDVMGLNPAFPVIVVGGTNGKGSTCAYLEAILRFQGYKTGLYTSPHLLHYNERLRIEGREASDAEIVAGLKAVEAARGDVSLTYFEHGTLAAMWQFVQAGVDVAILEVGLGGRLDAVNIFDPAVAVVTTIDLDHQSWLGETREAIGFEKAGIFRSGKAAVCGDPDPPKSLIEHARGIGAKLLKLGDNFAFEQENGNWCFRSEKVRLENLPMPSMSGKHQLANATTALAALGQVDGQLPVSLEAIHNGLANANIPGRFQRIHGPVEVVLDVAHNPESARALASNLHSFPVTGKSYAVFALLADKNASDVITPLKDCFDAWFVAGLPGERGQSGESLAAKARAVLSKSIEVFDNPSAAFAEARSRALEGDRITIFGSFHTVAEVLPDATTSRR